jgi:hypothetical protein
VVRHRIDAGRGGLRRHPRGGHCRYRAVAGPYYPRFGSSGTDTSKIRGADILVCRADIPVGARWDRLRRKEGKPYARLRELEPDLSDKILAGDELTLDEGSRAAKAIVMIESEFSPAEVGVPVQILTIEEPTPGRR